MNVENRYDSASELTVITEHFRSSGSLFVWCESFNWFLSLRFLQCAYKDACFLRFADGERVA